jgi:tRNA A-37 threonylcarbamoyl transferase component Bud32
MSNSIGDIWFSNLRGRERAQDEIVIAYRPGVDFSRWFQRCTMWLPAFFLSCLAAYGFAVMFRWDRFFEAFARFLVQPIKPFLLTTYHGAGIDLRFVEALSWPILLLMGAAIMYITFREGYKPSNIRVSPAGCTIFRRSFRPPDGMAPAKEVEVIHQSFAWKHVMRAHLRRKEGKRSHLDYEIVFALPDGDIAIRCGDIENPFERMQFIHSLEQRLGERFDPQIKEVFSDKGERESYTELWLKELNAPPKRDKLVPLTSGMLLHDREYRISERIGMGGQASVYLAESLKHGGMPVAIKEFILPVFPDPRVRLSAAQRFQSEAEIISRIRHPQIVRFLDLFIEDHRAYLVLERVNGRNLKQIVETDGPLDEAGVIQLAVQMCDILSYLHGQNPPIAHRDFTPDNLMLADDGLIKLIDFSVAQASISNVTGSVVGKPEYIAPEQFRGKPTPLSDIYSLGGTLYFLLTGNHPEAISVSKPVTASTELANVIAGATALDPVSRYQTPEDMKQALLACGTAGGVIDLRVLQRDYDK